MATVEISHIEIMALKKLAIINGALAQSISGQARIEQNALLRVLVEVLARADIAKETA
ncbi:hypothetical protein LRP31_25675 [Mesorhizobium mediterraneum]|uniref:hypothetical protein n=1 Tax=Mesorhizobium mediterraneum TaxID=43617 RepID=UPI0013051EEE|nr:hypothetical protein [Mesorhizobium mediterraneum]WIW52413.1 hypothetical protein LRP31_25675 [Mesorhizobium mediterraneum]